MKKIVFSIAVISLISIKGQFKIHIDAPAEFGSNVAYLYSLNGAKDILISKINKSGNSWDYKISEPYVGMLKMYFPEHNNSLSFISENKDVNIRFDSKNQKINNISYMDQPNKLMEEVQEMQKKKEQILPVLYQFKDYYYKANSSFGVAVSQEIDYLSQNNIVVDAAQNPFIAYYRENYNKFLVETANTPKPTKEEIADFLSKSGYLLETSSLLRPILISYLNSGSSSNIENAADKLLDKVDIETPRGQVILSELIDIFDAYGMGTLKDKFLGKAKNLKCSINDRLATTIKANKNVEINAKFPNYTFNLPTNTKAKSIYDVKADKKIILFWSASCSHCESEIPVLLDRYNQLQSKGIAIIGLSLDSNQEEYAKKANSLPWINDSELRGWYSTYAETYGIHATPTYFILDSSNKIISKPDHATDVIEYLQLK